MTSALSSDFAERERGETTFSTESIQDTKRNMDAVSGKVPEVQAALTCPVLSPHAE